MAMLGEEIASAMLLMLMLMPLLNKNHRVIIRSMLPNAAIVIGSLIIMHGLNLGIPYVSPKVTQKKIT